MSAVHDAGDATPSHCAFCLEIAEEEARAARKAEAQRISELLAKHVLHGDPEDGDGECLPLGGITPGCGWKASPVASESDWGVEREFHIHLARVLAEAQQ